MLLNSPWHLPQASNRNPLFCQRIHDPHKKSINNYINKQNIEIFENKNITPLGFTSVLLLDASHFTSHCYSEKGLIAFDLFTCRSCDDDLTYIDIYNELCTKLEASLVLSEYKITERFF